MRISEENGYRWLCHLLCLCLILEILFFVSSRIGLQIIPLLSTLAFWRKGGMYSRMAPETAVTTVKLEIKTNLRRQDDKSAAMKRSIVREDAQRTKTISISMSFAARQCKDKNYYC